MVKLKTLIEITDELTEQIVLAKDPKADIFKETEDGKLRMKKRYAQIRERIFTILKNNLEKEKA